MKIDYQLELNVILLDKKSDFLDIYLSDNLQNNHYGGEVGLDNNFNSCLLYNCLSMCIVHRSTDNSNMCNLFFEVELVNFA